MYWSTLETKRRTFFSVLCPTWVTEPSWLPFWSMTLYSLVTSISLAFWFTTRTGSVNRVPPPAPPAVTPACCCTCRCTWGSGPAACCGTWGA